MPVNSQSSSSCPGELIPYECLRLFFREAERRAKQLVVSPSLASEVTSTKVFTTLNSRRSRGVGKQHGHGARETHRRGGGKGNKAPNVSGEVDTV